ncbi:MAG: NrfD/PsrC family molybdoenzyme membrane anchor subunit [Chloroflexota bacterium]
MYERTRVHPVEVNDDLLAPVFGRASARLWIPAGVLGIVILAGLGGLFLAATQGLGRLGYTHTQMWTVQIVNFAYFAGVSHAGIMLTAVLRLTQAEWRRPVTRCAEILTLFALLAAAIYPFSHTGRPWRTAYWLVPYDFSRDIWPNVRSALIWDAVALTTYLISSAFFVYLTLVPDLAVIRDRSTGWRRRIYGALAIRFRGSERQWRLQKVAGVLLPTMILAVFVSDHSAVAWDFSMALVPGWHVTSFGPYFVAGSIYSGVSAVVLVMAMLRWTLRLDQYLTQDHFDAIGRLLIPVALIWFFFLLTDLYFGLASGDAVELAIWELRLFSPEWGPLWLAMLVSALLIPLPIWSIRALRRQPVVMFLGAALVSIGLYLERYILVITPLSFKHPFVFTWVTGYSLSVTEVLIILMSVAIIALGVLVFARILPIIPIYDVKESQVLARRLRIGQVSVPAVVRATAAEEIMP